MFKRLSSPLTVAALSCVLAFPSQAAAASATIPQSQDSARGALINNVRFLIAKGRPDLARTVVDQILAVQAEDAEAFLLLGDIELRAGRVPSAEKILERLRQKNPDGQETRELDWLLRLYTIDHGRLTQLRALRSGGNYPQAQAIARDLFPHNKAPASLSDEFSDLLMGPLFLRLRRSPVYAAPLVRDGKQTKPPRQSARLEPACGQVSSRPTQGNWQALGHAVLSSAYDALKSGNDLLALDGFKRAAKLLPGSAAAHGGLGIAHARLGQHTVALTHYGRAQQLERGRSSKPWRDLANTSLYWQSLGRAREEMASGNYSEARNLLGTAILSQPQEPEAAILLAEIDLLQSENEAAASAYQILTRRAPEDARVWRGLLTSLLRQPDVQAESLEQVWLAMEAAADTHGITRSDLLPVSEVRAFARRLRDAGEPMLAAATLDHSLRFIPTDAWLRYDRARLFIEQNQAAQAIRLMREGDALAPHTSDMKHALAIIAMAQAQDAAAIQSLESVPGPMQTQNIIELTGSARFELVMQRLQSMRSPGDARPFLEQAVALAQGDASRQLRVARIEMFLGAWEAAALRLDTIDVSRLSSQELVARAVLLSDIGRHEDASRALGRLVASWPSSVPVHTLIDAQILVADRQIESSLSLGAFDRAKEIATQTLSDWNQPDKRSSLVSAAHAHLLLRAKSEQSALAHVNSALEADPASTYALLTRARVFSVLGDRERTRADLMQLDRMLSLSAVEERLEVVEIWLALGEHEIARQWLAPLLSRRPGEANLRLAAARIASLEGDYATALQNLRYVSGTEDPSTKPWRITAGTLESFTVVNERNTPASLRAVRDSIASIEARRQPRFEIGTSHFGRAGNAGTSRVNGQEWTAALHWPVSYRGHVFGQVDRVNLDADQLPVFRSEARNFGQIAALPDATNLPPPIRQAGKAYSVGAGWVDDIRRLDFGVVGVGQPSPTITGGWKESFKIGGRDATLEISRRVETSSLLAYAGSRDPVSLQIWGGVSNNSVAIRISESLPNHWHHSGTVRVGFMAGTHIETNPYTQLQGRWTHAIAGTINGDAQAGVVINIWRYEKNSSGFTYGQGGYYSPQLYASMQLPLEFSHQVGPWRYALRGHLTYSWAREASAVYFPRDPALQAAASNPIAAANINQGPGVAFHIDNEYQINPSWILGATAGWEKSRDYNPYKFGIYIRHHFNDASNTSKMPLKSLDAYANF
jgi:cellulose synthase operon protein C